MPYLRGRVYYIDCRPDGYPHRIARSTGQRSKRLAQQMEATVRELAALGRHRPLDALRLGTVSLPDLYAAKVAGRLDELLRDRTDPPLRGTADEWAVGKHHRCQSALKHLYRVAPHGARLSWLEEPENVRTLSRALRSAGLAANTERAYLSALRSLLRDHGRTMPMPTLRKPQARRMRYLEADEIERLRDEAGEWWTAISLSLATGIRQGELLGLRVKDIDFDAGALIVEHGKSVSARRRVPVSGSVLAMLRGWIAAKRLASGDRLFPVAGSTLRGNWCEIRAAVGLEDVRWHDLRHTYAVHAARSGMPLPELQVKLGHASIVQTMRYAAYAPVSRSEHHGRALESMGITDDPAREFQRRVRALERRDSSNPANTDKRKAGQGA